MNHKWLTMGMTHIERLAFYTHPEPNTGCWIWIANSNKGGYGLVSYKGNIRLAHRVSYELHKGPIPEGLVIDHLCRNPFCINPDHLEPVTSKVNNQRSPISITSINSSKTHCDAGHILTDENVYRYPNGRRECRICSRVYKARYKKRMHELTGKWV